MITNFKHLIRNKDLQDLYYIARARDYQIRYGKNDVPQYVIEYGAKYMFRFKYETRNELTDITAINWLDDTLYNLQDSLEEILYKYPKCEDLDSDESGSLYKKAFESHVDAYLNAGFCNLNLAEWIDIGRTPDRKDIAGGVLQVLSVLVSCHVGIDAIASFATRPLSRELESIYKNFLQNSILQQLKR